MMAASSREIGAGIPPPDRTLPALGLPRRLLAVFRVGHGPITLPFYRGRQAQPSPRPCSAHLSPLTRERVRFTYPEVWYPGREGPEGYPLATSPQRKQGQTLHP